jgi:hypothetical protein
MEKKKKVPDEVAKSTGGGQRGTRVQSKTWRVWTGLDMRVGHSSERGIPIWACFRPSERGADLDVSRKHLSSEWGQPVAVQGWNMSGCDETSVYAAWM